MLKFNMKRINQCLGDLKIQIKALDFRMKMNQKDIQLMIQQVKELY